MSNGKELTVQEKPAMPTFSMTPRNLDEAIKFAELMAASDLVPAGYKGKPGNILVAIQKGYEVGLSPMAALETIAVINGRASMYGDGPLALVQAHPMYEWIDEEESTDTCGVCVIKRKGEKPYRATFDMDQAKLAGLLDKPGPWQQYRKRMLQMRARGFALRDKFADALKGIIQAEEALDIPVEVIATDTPTPVALTLKEKLKAQAQSTVSTEEPLAPEAAGVTDPPTAASSPDSAQADLDILVHDYEQQLTTPNEAMLDKLKLEIDADPNLNMEQKNKLRQGYWEKKAAFKAKRR